MEASCPEWIISGMSGKYVVGYRSVGSRYSIEVQGSTDADTT